MKNQKIKAAIGSLITLTTVTSTTLTAHAAPDDSVKCYGIVKAGMNDCATANSNCAGSAAKNNQPDAWIFMPKGLCEKIVGASTQPTTATNETPTSTPTTDNTTANTPTS